MSVPPRKCYVNLPVKHLDSTKEFFSKLGFEFNAQFSDENAACMIINEHTFVMLLMEPFFSSFTSKDLTDTSKSTEVILSFSADSREQVDEIVKKALASGGSAANDPTDHGFMYLWSFQDLDGHLWEVAYMDENAMNQG